MGNTHTHTKLPLTDGSTIVNKLIMDFLQDGILDVHEREKKSEDRLDVIEAKMSDILYKPISINNLTNQIFVPFGNSISNVTLIWKTNKDAKNLKIISPYGHTVKKEDESDNIAEDLSLLPGDKQHSFKDTNSYTITENDFWKLEVTEKEGKNEYKDGTITTTYAKGEVNVNVYCQYTFYWGPSNQESDWDSNFIINLKHSKYAHSSVGMLSQYGNYTFEKGNNTHAINDEYIYFAFTGDDRDTLYYDINNSGFRTELKKVATIKLNFNGNTIDYYLYKSDNKLTSEDDVKIYVSL